MRYCMQQVQRVAATFLLPNSSTTLIAFDIVLQFTDTTHTQNYFYVGVLRYIIIPHANNNNHRLMNDTARYLVESLYVIVPTVL